MNELEIFKNEEFGEIRTVVIENEPWFVGKDVAVALGYKDTADSIKRHVDNEDKLTRCFTASGQKREMIVINESGLYSLILSSKLPTAKKFKHWVTSEVLPTIRKHGAYMTDEKAFDVLHNAGGLADLLQQAAEQLKQKDVQIERMKPKALFADAVAGSNTSILIRELAKIIKGKGINIGEHKLFGWLREHGYLIRKYGCDYNTPTQKSMELGVMELKKTAVNKPDGTVITRTTPLITGKGQVYFVNKFCGKKE